MSHTRARAISQLKQLRYSSCWTSGGVFLLLAEIGSAVCCLHSSAISPPPSPPFCTVGRGLIKCAFSLVHAALEIRLARVYTRVSYGSTQLRWESAYKFVQRATLRLSSRWMNVRPDEPPRSQRMAFKSHYARPFFNSHLVSLLRGSFLLGSSVRLLRFLHSSTE
jgi:hypothetical protein